LGSASVGCLGWVRSTRTSADERGMIRSASQLMQVCVCVCVCGPAARSSIQSQLDLRPDPRSVAQRRLPVREAPNPPCSDSAHRGRRAPSYNRPTPPRPPGGSSTDLYRPCPLWPRTPRGGGAGRCARRNPSRGLGRSRWFRGGRRNPGIWVRVSERARLRGGVLAWGVWVSSDWSEPR
jgi:hypothetical protein